jgi:hypothetical protein
MSFFRRQRSLDELMQDPYFSYYVGRLIGGSEMTSHWLQLQEGRDQQEMGRRLGVIVGWFLKGQPPIGISEAGLLTSSSEAPTRVMSPTPVTGTKQ